MTFRLPWFQKQSILLKTTHATSHHFHTCTTRITWHTVLTVKMKLFEKLDFVSATNRVLSLASNKKKAFQNWPKFTRMIDFSRIWRDCRFEWRYGFYVFMWRPYIRLKLKNEDVKNVIRLKRANSVIFNNHVRLYA